MNDLTITNFNGIETVDSRQVAEAVGKSHTHLIRDIARYCEYLTETKIGFSDFFIESTYQDSTGRTLPCYQITRKGCEMVANKMTGQKGTVFTAMYVNAFHAMEQHINGNDAKPTNPIQSMNAEARLLNAKARQAQIMLNFAKLDLSTASKELLAANAMQVMTGKQVLPLPETVKTYSAGEVGKMLGVSGNKIGRLANLHGIKTEEYGITVLDTAHNGKQIPTFRYNDKAIDIFRKLLTG